MVTTDLKRLRKDMKRLSQILSLLRENTVFVEGLRDKEALSELGVKKVLTISGNLRRTCARLGAVGKVIVLTDMDRRGEQLLALAKEELEACSVDADIETRRILAGILKLRFFEDAARKYAEFVEMAKEMEEEHKI